MNLNSRCWFSFFKQRNNWKGWEYEGCFPESKREREREGGDLLTCSKSVGG
jgi:hypothetical protein